MLALQPAVVLERPPAALAPSAAREGSVASAVQPAGWAEVEPEEVVVRPVWPVWPDRAALVDLALAVPAERRAGEAEKAAPAVLHPFPIVCGWWRPI